MLYGAKAERIAIDRLGDLRPPSPHSTWLAVVFLLTALLYALVQPPFEVRDEPAHFAKAAQLASWSFPSVFDGEQPGAMIQGPLSRLADAWPWAEWSQAVSRRSVSQLVHQLHETAGSETGPRFASFVSLGSYPEWLYVPQAAGLRLAAWAGLSPLAQFYAGRLAAGLVTVAILLTAIAILPYGGRSMLAICILPGVSASLASYSADSMIIGVAFLTIALLVRGGRAIRSRSGLALPPLILVLVLAKGVYLPIAAASLFQRSTSRRWLLWVSVWAALGVAAFLVWFGVVDAGAIIPQSYVNRTTLQHVVSTSPRQQIGFMIQHPVPALHAILGTMVARLPAYAVDGIGRLGWMTVLLPVPLYALGMATLALGVVATEPDAVMPTARQRCLWLGLALSTVVLVHVALYLTCAALGETYVHGVQARYFVPILPLVALAARVRLRAGTGLARLTETVFSVAAALLMVGGVATAVHAFWQF